MKKPKKTLTLAEYRKRKRDKRNLATAFACMALCAGKMAPLFARMGSSALKVGGLYNDDVMGHNAALDEAIVNTKKCIDFLREKRQGIEVRVPGKNLLHSLQQHSTLLNSKL